MKKQESFHLFNGLSSAEVVSTKHNCRESVVFLLFPFPPYSITSPHTSHVLCASRFSACSLVKACSQKSICYQCGLPVVSGMNKFKSLQAFLEEIAILSFTL